MIRTNTRSSAYLELPRQQHFFHILTSSLYPLYTGLFLGLALLVATAEFYSFGAVANVLSKWSQLPGVCHFLSLFVQTSGDCFIIFLILFFSWLISVLYESAQGDHTAAVQGGLRGGILLFIVSEVMFFFAFFWAFIHLSLDTAVATVTWPPAGSQYLDPFALPLVNTGLLLLSGVMVTGAHHCLCVKWQRTVSLSVVGFLLLTLLLGVTFLACQFYEYRYGVQFSWKNNTFGSIFFMMTGFHGLHVTLGALLLLLCFARYQLAVNSTLLAYSPKQYEVRRLTKTSFGRTQHVGLEAAAWYWHFVDVVWLGLYLLVYLWGQQGSTL